MSEDLKILSARLEPEYFEVLEAEVARQRKANRRCNTTIALKICIRHHQLALMSETERGKVLKALAVEAGMEDPEIAEDDPRQKDFFDGGGE